MVLPEADNSAPERQLQAKGCLISTFSNFQIFKLQKPLRAFVSYLRAPNFT